MYKVLFVKNLFAKENMLYCLTSEREMYERDDRVSERQESGCDEMTPNRTNQSDCRVSTTGEEAAGD